MLSRLIRSPITFARRLRATSAPVARALAIGKYAAHVLLFAYLPSHSALPPPFSVSGTGIAVFAAATQHGAANLPRSLCNAQQQDPEQQNPVVPDLPKAAADSDAARGSSTGAGSPPGAACAAAVTDTALSMASAAAAEASAAAAAAVAAALDAVNAKHDHVPAVDAATSAAAVAEVIYESGVARQPSVLDSRGDAVAKLQQHAQVLVGDNQEVNCAAAAACSGCATSQPAPEQVKPAAIIPPLVGTPDSYKQLYENAVEELNKRGASHLSRVNPCAARASHVSPQPPTRPPVCAPPCACRGKKTSPSSATCCCGSWRLSASACSECSTLRYNAYCICGEAAVTRWPQLAAMKDVFAAEMLKREEAYAARVEQAVGTVRDVAVVHVQQETDVVKAVAASEMQQEIASAQEALSQEYAACRSNINRLLVSF